jgi:hypothetical protein
VFQAAAALQPQSGDPWVHLGIAYLAMGRNNDATSAWDKALKLGQPVGFRVCEKQGKQPCLQRVLSLSATEVSIIQTDGHKMVSITPADTKIKRVMNNGIVAVFNVEANNIKFELQYGPYGVACTKPSLLVCPPEGLAQEWTVAQYVEQTVPKLAAGAFSHQPSQ